MRGSSCKLLLMPPSEIPGQAEYDHTSYTNHRQSDAAGAILFQSCDSQETQTLCLATAQPDWALILTFKPRFAGKQNSTRDMFLASSQFLREHGCVGRGVDMAHMCNMIQAMKSGEHWGSGASLTWLAIQTGPFSKWVTWPKWLIFLSIPQFPLSEIQYIKRPGAEQCLIVGDGSSFSLIS